MNSRDSGKRATHGATAVSTPSRGRDTLARIDRPTLVTGGTVSHVLPRSQRFIQSRIAGARYREFSEAEGGAHFPFLEAPEVFSDVIRDFLNESDGR